MRATAIGRWLGQAPWAVLLGLGTLLLYSQVAQHPFIYFDDDRYVFENEWVLKGLTPSGVAWAFGTLHFSNWHPLTWLSHMLDVELFGLDSGKHHLFNALLHALNAGLLFALLRRLTGAVGRSALVAAVFAVHPLHVESVAWVSERKDLLSTLFGFLALLAWHRYSGRPSVRRYWLVTILFAASLLAKPMWVTFPFLLLLLDVWPLRRLGTTQGSLSAGRALLEKLPFLALSAASSVITLVAQRRGGAVGDDVGLALRAANALVGGATYFFKALWPTRLAIYYPFPAEGLSGLRVVSSAALLASITVLALALARRQPFLLVGWCWFLGMLVPVIGLVQVGGQAMADRYTYVPLVGLSIALVWGAHRLAQGQRPSALVAASAAIVAVLSALTYRQLGHWSSHERLFTHAAEVTDGNAVAQGVLFRWYRKEGRLDEALAHARAAIDLDPSSARGWNDLGAALKDLELLSEAELAFSRSVRLGPTAMGWANLGEVRLKLGRPGPSIAASREALRLEPERVDAWSVLGAALSATGHRAEAIEAFAEAARLRPSDWNAWFNLGVCLHQAGRPGEAVAAFRSARELEPSDPDLLRRLAEAEAAAGQ